jgi:hypothetical protein
VYYYLFGADFGSDRSNPNAPESINSISDLIFTFIVPAALLILYLRWFSGRDERKMKREDMEARNQDRAELRKRLEQEKRDRYLKDYKQRKQSGQS